MPYPELIINLTEQDRELIRQQAPKIAAKIDGDPPPGVKEITFNFVVDRIIAGEFINLSQKAKIVIDNKVGEGVNLRSLLKEAGVKSKGGVSWIFLTGMRRLLKTLPEEVQTHLLEQRVFEIGMAHPHQEDTKVRIGQAAHQRWKPQARTRTIQEMRKRWQDQEYLDKNKNMARAVRYFWTKLEETSPETLELYAGIPLSSFMRWETTEEHQKARQQTNLPSLIKSRYGLGEPKQFLSAIGEPLGLSATSVFGLIGATLKCLAEDSSVPFYTSLGDAAQAAYPRIRNTLQEYHQLKTYLAQPETPLLERATIKYRLQGNNPTTIAEILNAEMKLTPPLNRAAVLQILRKALGKAYYLHPAALTQRSLNAREVLTQTSQEEYTNHKAVATEQILALLYQGRNRTEVIAQMNLHLNDYRALIGEVLYELKPDLMLPRTHSITPRAKHDIVTALLPLYRRYRQQLGEVPTDSGHLTARLLSYREKGIVEQLARGASDQQLANEFNGERVYMGIAADWLLGQRVSFTYAERLAERKQLHLQFVKDLMANPSTIPVQLRQVGGIATDVLLELLAQDYTYDQICEWTQSTTGGPINSWRLWNRYSAVKAYYHQRVGTPT